MDLSNGKILGTVKRPPNKRRKTWRRAAAAAGRGLRSTDAEASNGGAEATPGSIAPAAAGDGTGFGAAAGGAAPYATGNYFEDRQLMASDASAALDGGIDGADVAGDVVPDAATGDIDYRQFAFWGTVWD
jgi:hypothetical protein